ALSSHALFVQPMSGLGATKRACQIVRRDEGRSCRVDPPSQTGRDLLEQPAVPVRIMERRERAVAAMIGIRTARPQPAKQIGFVRTGINHGSISEYFADGNSATQQLVARRLH